MTRRGDANALYKELRGRMAACTTAESLNEAVLMPFIAALEDICADRGYLLNTFGTNANLAVTTEQDAPVIYDLIEEYLDGRDG